MLQKLLLNVLKKTEKSLQRQEKAPHLQSPTRSANRLSPRVGNRLCRRQAAGKPQAKCTTLRSSKPAACLYNPKPAAWATAATKESTNTMTTVALHTRKASIIRSRPHKSKPTGTKASQPATGRRAPGERIVAEHVMRWLKRFRILAGPYRNRRKRFGLRFNLIAALYNAHLHL